MQNESDPVSYAADSAKELAGLSKLRKSLKGDGAIWVVSRKGIAAGIKDADVIAAGKKADLVDTKVAAFSESRTALKLIVPVRDR